MTTDPGKSTFDPHQSGDLLFELLPNSSCLTIVAPFITMHGMSAILTRLPETASCDVFTRWIPAEVASGVSDPRVLRPVSDRSGEVRLHTRLHAKAFILADRALVGSMNVTAPALGVGNASNLELLVEIEADHPNLMSLMRALRSTAAIATEATATAVLQAAQALDAVPVENTLGTTASWNWIPKTAVPQS